MNVELPISLSSLGERPGIPIMTGGWSKNPLHDHNYAAILPPDKPTSTAHSPPHSTADDTTLELKEDEDQECNHHEINIESLQEKIESLSSQLEKCREEIDKKNAQVAEMARVMIDLQKKLSAADAENTKLERRVDKETFDKTDLQSKLDRFRNSAANVCCGVTVFIDEFRRQFKTWCLTNEIREKDQKELHCGLNRMSCFVQDKLNVWVEDGMLTQAELDKAKEAITELAKLTEEKTWNDEEANLTAGASVEPVQLAVESREDLESAPAELGKLPEPEEEQVEKNEEEEVIPIPAKKSAVPTGQHAIVEDTSENRVYKCTCGMICKRMSGLKLHIRSTRRPPKSVVIKVEVKEVAAAGDVDNSVVLEPPSHKRRKLDGRESQSKRVQIKKEVVTPPTTPLLSFTPSFPPSSVVKSEPCSSSPSTSDEGSSESPEKRTRTKDSKISQMGWKGRKSRQCHKVIPSKPLECKCGYKAMRKELITKHISYYRSDRTFPCDHCPTLFLNLSYLNKHYRAKHMDKLKRSTRGKGIRKDVQKSVAISPAVKTENPKPLPALIDALRTRSISKKRRDAAKNKRRKMLRTTAKERFSCQQCHRRFPHFQDLIHHLARRLHGGEALAGRIPPPDTKKAPRSPMESSRSTDKAAARASGSKILNFRRSARPQTESEKIRMWNERYNSHYKAKTKIDAKGRRCECGRKCGTQKYRKLGTSSVCNLCGELFVCLEFLKEHLQQRHHILCSIPKVSEECKTIIKKEKQLIQPSSSNGSRNDLAKKKVINHHPSSSSCKNARQSQPSKTVHHRQVKGSRRGAASSSSKCSCGKVYSTRKLLQKHIEMQSSGLRKLSTRIKITTSC